MKLLALLAAFFVSVRAAYEGLDLVNPSTATIPGSTVPGKYIVEFSQNGSSKFRKRDGSTDTTEFFNTLQGVGRTATPHITFDSSIFHGISFQLDDTEASSAAILVLPEVEKIWPVEIYSLPVTTLAEADVPVWNPHNITNVNLVHALGHKGKGSIVAIVDSGVDYNNPALGGGFGPGFKISGGHDFVGDAYVIGGPLVPDEDPLDCLGHGTHVAGIIGSIDKDLPGVAPEATLRSYKVFGCSDGAPSDAIMAAFIRAYEEGADVINASLGNAQGFADNPTALVVGRIQAAGTFVVVAAGNNGDQGPFFTSNSANGIDVTAAGSIEQPTTADSTPYLNAFTSWGPTLDGRMKPDISAPGGHINSTYKNGQHAVLSGTSMASPYIAGVAALFFESHGGRAALGVGASLLAHNTIQSSGKPVAFEGGNVTAHVARQGSGLVDALKVIQYTTSIFPSVIHLNDTAHYNPTHTVTIKNSGTQEVTYTLTHEAGPEFGGKQNFLNGDTWVPQEAYMYWSLDLSATVEISTQKITIAPGSLGTFSATFTEPSIPDARTLPVYSGAIIIAGSNFESVRLSYQGIKGSLYDQNVWETNRGTPLFLDGHGIGQLADGLNYTFGDSPVPDGPTAYFNVLWSTRELSVDFVSRNWTQSDWVHPAIPGKNNVVGSVRVRPNAISGEVINFPLRLQPRGGVLYAYPQDTLASDEKVPEGEFRLLARTLRTYGDPQNLDDWQWKLSAWFRIIHGVPPNITTTEVPTPTTTAIIVPTCGTSVPLAIRGKSSSDTNSHPVYRYSDFLAYDLIGDKTPLGGFDLTPEGYLKLGQTNLLLSVHSSENSLVYMKPAGQITGAYSFLKWSIIDGNLTYGATDGSTRSILSECSDTGLFRFGSTIADGCKAVSLTVEQAPNPTCTFTTATAPQTASATATAIPTAVKTAFRRARN